MSQLRKVHRFLAFLSFLIPFAVYYMTCYPSISLGESGMWGTAAFHQQVPLGPGAPLWVIVAGAFAKLLPGNPAYTLTLFSALCTAFSAMMVYLIVVALLNSPSLTHNLFSGEEKESGQGEEGETLSFSEGGDEGKDGLQWHDVLPLVAGVIAALSFAWFDSEWTTATQITNRSAGTLLVSLLLWGAIRWYKSDSDGEPDSLRWLLLTAYVLGLSIGVDHIALGAIPGIAMLVWMRRFVPPVEHGRYAIGSLVAMIGMLLLWYAFGATLFLPFLLLAFVGALIGMFVPTTRSAALACGFLIVFTALGYSLYTQVVIRSEAHPALNMLQTDSEGKPSIRAYINDSPVRSGFYERSDDRPQESVRQLAGQVYTRILLWNTVGRASDLSTAPPAWFTVGDEARANYIEGTNGNDIFPVRFFVLPLLFALIGLAIHLRSDWRTGTALLALFFSLGPLNAMIWNINSFQSSAVEGLVAPSLLIVAIWIGIGAAGLARAVRNWSVKNAQSGSSNESQGSNLLNGILVLSFILVPLNLLYNGWNGHDHYSDRLPHDYARNLLQSCEQNAILFTGDYFPLLYLQQVEGMRPDVRVVNPGLTNLPWYQHLMLEEEWGNAPLTFDSTHEENGATIPLPLPDGSDTLIWRVQGIQQDSTPVISPPEQKMIQTIVRHNRWKRPIYFAMNLPSNLWGGLEEFFRWEGLAFKVVPERNLQGIEGFSEFPIDYDRMIALLFPKGDEGFLFNGLNEGKGAFSRAERQVIPFYHRAFIALAADALKKRNEPKGCLSILDGMDRTISIDQFPLPYWTAAAVATLYDEAGGKAGAEKYARHAIVQIERMGTTWRDDPIARRYNPHQTAARMYTLLGDYDKAISSMQTTRRDWQADPIIRGLVEELRVERFLAKGDTAAARSELYKIIEEYGTSTNPTMHNNRDAWKEMLKEME